MGKFLDRLLGKGLEQASDAAPAQFDSTGERWTFRSVDFDMEVNFADRTARITAGDGEVVDKRESSVDKESKKGRVDVAIDIMHLTTSSSKKTKYSSSPDYQRVHGTGFANGQSVPVTGVVVTGYSGGERSTGRSRLTLTWHPQKYDVRPPTLARQGDEIKSYGGGVSWSRASELGVNVDLDVDNATASSFAEAWKQSIEPRIKAMRAEDHEVLLDERRQEEIEKFIKREDEAKAILKIAEASGRSMRAEAGVAGDFVSWNYSRTTGAILFMAAVDKIGKGFFMVGADRWAGSLAKARATVVAVEAPDPNKHAPKLHLEIEVRDAEFELAHLKRRRFMMLHGSSRSDLNEWADRINILGERVAAASAPVSPPDA